MGTTLLTSLSFDRLHREFKPKLIAVARDIVRDEETAGDIVNDSFMALWERRDKMEFTNIEGYLFQSVRNNCLAYRRSAQIDSSAREKIFRRERLAMDYYTKTVECCDPEELFCDEIMEIYVAELARMPELTREIFKAGKIEGRSYREISESLNIPPQKIDYELRKAILKLRRSLVDYLPILAAFL